jgi:hypothetical protein
LFDLWKDEPPRLREGIRKKAWTTGRRWKREEEERKTGERRMGSGCPSGGPPSMKGFVMVLRREKRKKVTYCVRRKKSVQGWRVSVDETYISF